MKVLRIISLTLFITMLASTGGFSIYRQPVAEASVSTSRPLTLAGTLNLDGQGDYVQVPNHPDLNPATAITIEAWVRRADTGRCETVVGKDYISGYWLGFCSQRIRFYTSGQGSAQDGVHSIPANEWTHIAVTFDGTTRRYYINGMLDYESISPATLPSNSRDLAIGANSGSSYPFRGNLAEVRIWSIARTQSDIRRDMMRQIDYRRPGLIAVWTLVGSAADALARHGGTLRGNANFSGPVTPAFDHNPIWIPRLGVPPNLNGVCLPGEYGNLRLPVWYGNEWAVNNLAWVYVGATETDLYVCMDRLRWGSNPNQFASVYLDLDNDAGAVAQANDYRVNIQWPGRAVWSQHGNGAGSFIAPGLSNYAVRAGGSELEWTAEYRIGRDALPASYSVFRMQFLHQWLTAVGDDYGWPLDQVWNSPDAWETFRINDSNIPATFDVQVQAIEVTQGVRTDIPTRTPPNGLSLLPPDNTFQTHVARRRTIVRVYPWIDIRSSGTVPPLSAALYGYDNSGTPLPGSPLSPENVVYSFDPSLSLEALRSEAARSWNFVLPESWTSAGRIRLEAVANPPGPSHVRECEGCEDGPVILFGVRFYRVGPVVFDTTLLRWANREDDGTITRVMPSLFDVANAFAFLSKTWPVSTWRLRLHTATTACATNFTDCRDPYSQGSLSPQARQRAERDRRGVRGGDPYLFPALYHPDSITLQRNAAGREFLARVGCAGNAGVPGPDYWAGACGPTLAHESAHAGPARNHAGGVHGSIGAIDSSYPDPHGGIEPNAYGFDIFAMQAVPPVGRITHTHDYMSYGRRELVWTSQYTWNAIRTWLGTSAVIQASVLSGSTVSTVGATLKTAPYLQITGQIATDGSTIDPAYRVELPDGSGDYMGQGSYALTLYDQEGSVVFVRRFEPTHRHSDWADHQESVTFSESIPLKQGVARITLSHNGQVLASREALPGTPNISLISPTPGAQWGHSGTTTVSWRVNASEGEPLIFYVEGSPDAGATWTLLGVVQGDTAVNLDLAGLPAAGPGWTIRVQATDGLNVGLAQVSPISIEAKPPQVLLVSPRNGAVVAPSHEVLLVGQAFDWQDGQLADGQLSWQVDGKTVGKGAETSVRGLSMGPHTITLRATNSNNLQEAMSITITVATDTDFDGLPDTWEQTYGFNPQIPNAGDDPDQDHLANWQELREGTNPLQPDSDQDGFSDKEEVTAASDPLDPNSTPYTGMVWPDYSTLYLPMLTHGGK